MVRGDYSRRDYRPQQPKTSVTYCPRCKGAVWTSRLQAHQRNCLHYNGSSTEEVNSLAGDEMLLPSPRESDSSLLQHQQASDKLVDKLLRGIENLQIGRYLNPPEVLEVREPYHYPRFTTSYPREPKLNMNNIALDEDSVLANGRRGRVYPALAPRYPSRDARASNAIPPPTWDRLLRYDGGGPTRPASNEIRGIMPILQQSLSAWPRFSHKSIESAYLCDATTSWFFSDEPERGFCGYQNIRAQLNYLRYSEPSGFQPPTRLLPHRLGYYENLSIPQIQEWIEEGWNLSPNKYFNDAAEFPNNSVYGSKRFIGVSEYCACMSRLNARYLHMDHMSWEDLIDHISTLLEEASRSSLYDPQERVHCTNQSPIMLVVPGHSMTIVGLIKFRNGEKSLLVFDPDLTERDHPRRLAGHGYRSIRLADVEKLLRVCLFREVDYRFGRQCESRTCQTAWITELPIRGSMA